MRRIEHDMATGEIGATIAESGKLASILGITGTPAYVIGNHVVLGAVGIDALKARIASVRVKHVN